MPTPAEPAAARIDGLDVLRGLALFGVLAINLVNEFRVSLFEQFLPPPVHLPPLDLAARFFLSVAVDFKAFALFSLLFGVGLAIQFERLAGRADRGLLLVRRLLVLLAFGLAHLLLVWNGDILTEYALAGLVLLPWLFVRRQRLLAGAAAAALLLYLVLPALPLPWHFPGPAWLRAHVAEANAVVGQGAYAAVLAFQWAELPAIAQLHGYVFPRTVGLMLLGVWAWRSGGVAWAGAHAAVLRTVAGMAVPLGLVLSVLAEGWLAPWGLALPRFAVGPAGALAPVVLAVGYAALVLWAVAATRWGRLLAWAAPVGRMAFSNYIAQSLLLCLLFHGYGLGLMGQVGVAAGLGLAVVIYAVQSLCSRLWLRSHRFGPLEWLWRTLMYGTRQPWRV